MFLIRSPHKDHSAAYSLMSLYWLSIQDPFNPRILSRVVPIIGPIVHSVASTCLRLRYTLVVVAGATVAVLCPPALALRDVSCRNVSGFYENISRLRVLD